MGMIRTYLIAICMCMGPCFAFAAETQGTVIDLGRIQFSPRSVHYSPSGEKLAIAGSGCVVLDLRQHASKAMTLEVKGFVVAASYSPQGDFLATLSVNWAEDATGNTPDDFLPAIVSLFDGQSGKLIRQFKGHERSNRFETMSLAWFPDGKRLATSANKVLLWDVDSGRKIAEAPGLLGPVAVTRDGKSLIGLGKRKMSIVQWDIETSKKTVLFRGQYVIYRLALSPNGKWLALCDSNRRAQLLSLDGHAKYELPKKHAIAIAFSHDSEILAIGGHEATVDLWSMERKQFVKRIPAPTYSPTTTSLAFSPNDAQLAHASGTFLSGHAYAFYGFVGLFDVRFCRTLVQPPDDSGCGDHKNRRRFRRRGCGWLKNRRRRCCVVTSVDESPEQIVRNTVDQISTADPADLFSLMTENGQWEYLNGICTTFVWSNIDPHGTHKRVEERLIAEYGYFSSQCTGRIFRHQNLVLDQRRASKFVQDVFQLEPFSSLGTNGFESSSEIKKIEFADDKTAFVTFLSQNAPGIFRFVQHNDKWLFDGFVEGHEPGDKKDVRQAEENRGLVKVLQKESVRLQSE